MQEKYEFPLAVGYADPVILRWKGSYYFVSTNDNLNNIGIFVRKGKKYWTVLPGGRISDLGSG